MYKKLNGAEKLKEKLDRLSEPEKGVVLNFIKKTAYAAGLRDESAMKHKVRNS